MSKASDPQIPPELLKRVEQSTLSHYEERAEQFWEGTRDHDVSQNIDALLRALPSSRSLKILDFGCGPGRDLVKFKAQGHEAVGLDGSAEFCKMAVQYSGCEVLHQSFSELDLVAESYDGIFANASLFHVPKALYPQVLKACFTALKPGGVLFSSNPRGEGEGMNGLRYGHYMELATSEAYLRAAGFEMVEHYYRPVGMPRHLQHWLAIVARKTEKIKPA
ncbi:class I SAM-dependent methyltransferase [Neptuniibacter caesariensis]|uniref:Methyltransferase domain-containing protein n=1 Tax=Neptuniibacter caesariensis TaxID=207954 RepID=A0A7U8C3X0_NEPCE|nr:class I SAM-dependent methyltransferase [Neptuniibacter caesariensis]EAR59979.1 hypothetical protein MED92_02706 [Oceanospirillum sp. MED92] [Neptuniibacter caesariensis]